MTMPDPIRRALRTFVQAFLGSLLTSGVLSAAATDGVVDWSALKKVAIAAAAAGVVSVFTLIQNLLEDHTSFPAVLKAPASEGENPVPDGGRSYSEDQVQELMDKAHREGRAKRAMLRLHDQVGAVSPAMAVLITLTAILVFVALFGRPDW